MDFLTEIFNNPTVPKKIKHAAVDRINADPGVPIANPTKSFWLSDVHPDFAAAPASALPSSADCVIIGSGVTGTAVARQLIQNRSSLEDGGSSGNIVLLDARDICGGATGRNGGHINEVGFGDYRGLRKRFGKEKAMKIVRFRLSHLGALMKVAAEEGVEAEGQVRSLNTATAVFDEAVWSDVKNAVMEFKKDFGGVAAEWKILESREELKEYGTETASGIILSPAGAAWPYRLVTGILSNLTRRDPAFHVYPFTPVTSIQESSSSSARIVSTPRGQITTQHVVHCTNSHIGHLLPALRRCIFPTRGQMSAQTPPSSFSFQGNSLSWSFNYRIGFDYLTQIPEGSSNSVRSLNDSRPIQGGEMMLGGGMAQSTYQGIEDLGISRDDELNSGITAHLSKALPMAFTSAGENPFEVKSMWTGIMGFSADAIPWVGRLPESLTKRDVWQSGVGNICGPGEDTTQSGGEWISAGYTGEGMVNAWLCGTALAMMISGQGKKTEAWFPQEYLVSETRVRDHTFNHCVRVD